ncbi:MAG: class I SAM-dependent methyltransferase [Candidatus Omnitrophica bacterium]|nr:class I SAM-dependent methyltransferase [Candidatus Omnitrophota bacterium]
MAYKIKCDVCGSAEYLPLYDMDGKYSIIRCSGCGLWLSYPILNNEEIERVYAKYHEVWGIVGKDEEMHRKMRHLTFRCLFKSLSRFTPHRGRLLDIGCATGICMEVGEEFGWDVYGVDISEEAARVAKARFGSRVEALDFVRAKEMPSDHYDMIIMTDVLEHLNGARIAVEKVYKMLRPGGIAVIVTVDTSSLFAKFTGKRWPYIHRQHLVYFSKKNLNAFLRTMGFKILGFKSAFKSINPYYAGEYMRQKSEESAKKKSSAVSLMEGLIGRLPPRLKYHNFIIPSGDIVAIAKKG